MISTNNRLNKPELRILHVFSNLGVGGAEIWLLALLRYFKQAATELPFRLKTDVFLTHGMSNVFDEEAKSLGAQLYYSRFGRSSLLTFCRDWRRILRSGRYHAIHDHQEFAAGLHFLMGVGNLAPIRIAHLHNPWTYFERYRSSHLRRLTVALGNRLIGRFGTHVLSTSEQLLDEQGFFHKRYAHLCREAVYCGFDTSRYAGKHSENFNSLCDEFGFPRNSHIVLFVGRLDSNPNERLNQKNPVFALEAARAMAVKDASFRFLMAGGGEDMRQKLQDNVRDWNLSDRLFLIGRRSDVPRLMLGSHLLLLPSIAEGLGMVAVEAQAAGLPSLVSEATPKECSVVPGLVNFLRLDEGKSEWSDRALAIINKERPQTMPCNATIRRSRFAIENSAAHLLEIYTERWRNHPGKNVRQQHSALMPDPSDLALRSPNPK